MDFLTDNEKDIFKDILIAARKIKEEAGTAKLVREVEPIESWLNQEYYVGPDGLHLYDYWKREMIEIFGTNRDKYNEVIVTGGLGCRPLDTKYHTSIGYKSLFELENSFSGVSVLSPTGRSSIVAVHRVGKKATKIIEFSNGYIMEATTDHRIKVLTSKGIVWKCFEDLTYSDNVLSSRRPEGYNGNKYDYDKSYLMGYVYGDGWVSYNNGKCNDKSVIGVLYQLNESYSFVLRDLAEKYIGGSEKEVRKGNTSLGCVRSTNRDLIEEWEGIGNSDTKKIPGWFFLSSLRDKSMFLSGLFDSDGYVGKDTIELTLNSKELIEQVRALLKEFGISSVINWCIGQKRNRLHIQGKQNWVRLNDVLSLKVSYKKEALSVLAEIPYSRNDRTCLKGLSGYLLEKLKKNPLKFSRRLDSLKSMRYGKQEVTMEKLRRFYFEFSSYCNADTTLYQVLFNDCEIINPVKIEDGYCECGDIEVDGHEYINEGIWQHNTGKSTFAVFCMLRKLYELSCYTNVPTLFELMPTSMVALMYFSVSKPQAELTGFGQFRSIIDNVPYFQECFARNSDINSLLSFPSNLVFLYGSAPSHSIGLNLIGSILDEANFFQQGAQNPDKSVYEYSKVAQLYTAIVNRAKSRFLSKGKDSSLSILVSSNTTGSSFTETRIKEASTTPNVKVINARLWEVKPKGHYSSEMFYVFQGSDLIDPFIIEDITDIKRVAESMNMALKEGETIADTVNGMTPLFKDYFVGIPIDFRKQFDSNVITALQDIAGKSVAPSGRLFNSHIVYNDACTGNSLRHPFYKTDIVISTNDKVLVKDYLDKSYRPSQRNKKRYIHIDQSTTTDRTGFASAFVSDYIEVDGIRKPVIGVDIQLRITPPKAPKKISIGKVRDFVFYMKNIWGLEIGKVTYDSFASAESLQVLGENGVPSGYLSVDRTDEQYIAFINLLYEGRVKLYHYKPTEEELFELIHFRERRKVDHPDGGGSKDVMDAIVGAVWNALQDTTNRVVESDAETVAFIMGNDEDDLFSEEELLMGGLDDV